MRILLLVLASFLAAVAGAAEQAPRYAVISLIGETLTVVTAHETTGSNMDRNVRQPHPLPDPVLDNEASFAVEDGIKESRPGAQVVLLAVRDRSALKSAAGLELPLPEMLPALRRVAAGAGATHLVVLTRHRDDARMPFFRGYTGKGRLEGVGFYLDYHVMTSRGDTGEAERGFMAPYAYYKVSLVDVAKDAVLSQVAVTAAWPLSAARAASGDPWETLSGKDKIEALRSMLRDETRRAMPALLEKAPR